MNRESMRPPYLLFTVSLLVLLGVYAAAFMHWHARETPSARVRQDGRRDVSLQVRLVNDSRDAGAITSAERAIVFVDAPYSIPAVKNGQLFLRGMMYLVKEHPNANADIFWINDDAEEWCQEWIKSLGVDEILEIAAPAGNGAILWFERGKLVQFRLGYQIESAYFIKDETVRLW